MPTSDSTTAVPAKTRSGASPRGPSPPIGPALGQHGVNIMEFCKAFNAATQKLEQGMPIPVVITVYQDKSFTFITKSPPASVWSILSSTCPNAASRPIVAVLLCAFIVTILVYCFVLWPIKPLQDLGGEG